MSETAEKTDPALWERIKAEVTTGAKGGKPGQWSARNAQLAVHEYQKRGGGYVGGKDPHNHLHEWTQEHWGTRSGKPSGKTGERYLPEKARAALTDAEYRRTTAPSGATPPGASRSRPSPRTSPPSPGPSAIIVRRPG